MSKASNNYKWLILMDKYLFDHFKPVLDDSDDIDSSGYSSKAVKFLENENLSNEKKAVYLRQLLSF